MNNELTTKKPLWRRVLRKILFAAIFLIVLGIIVSSAWNYILTRQIKTEIQKIRAAGQPVTFEDWEAQLPKIDDAQNAARYYKAAMDLLLPQIKDDYGHLWLDNSKYSTVQTLQIQKEVKLVLEACRLSFELVDTGAKLPACRDELWIKNGMEQDLGKLRLIRQMARLLSLRTMYLVSLGKGDDAVDSVISSLRFLRFLDNQPLLVNYLVTVACRALAYQDIKYVLQFSRPSQSALEKLHAVLTAVENPGEFERVILGERVYGIEVMKNTHFSNNDLPGFIGLPERWSWIMKLSPFMLQMNLGYLKDMAKFLENSRKPWPKVFTEWKQYHTGSIFGEILQPAYQTALKHVGRNLAQERSILIAGIIERYRRTHNGTLPDTLSVLVPVYTSKLPLDPFTGKDLLYRHDQNSYTVYSVGDNLKDDQGDVEPKPVTSSASETKRNQDWGVKINLHPNKK